MDVRGFSRVGNRVYIWRRVQTVAREATRNGERWVYLVPDDAARKRSPFYWVRARTVERLAKPE